MLTFINAKMAAVPEAFAKTVVPYLVAARRIVSSSIASAFSIAYASFSAVFSTIYNGFTWVFNHPWLAKYLAQLAKLNALVAGVLQPLLTRVPWWLVRILQPLARLAPLFKGLQALFAIAAIPYVAAAIVGLVIFIYSAAMNIVANLSAAIKVIIFGNKKVVGIFAFYYKYLQDFYNENVTIYNNGRNEGLLARAGNFVANLAELVLRLPIIMIVILGYNLGIAGYNAWNAALTDATDAASETLNFPLFAIMRRPIRAALGLGLGLGYGKPQDPMEQRVAKLSGVVNTMATGLGYRIDPKYPRIDPKYYPVFLTRLNNAERGIYDQAKGLDTLSSEINNINFSLSNAYLTHYGRVDRSLKLVLPPPPASDRKRYPDVVFESGNDDDRPSISNESFGFSDRSTP